jgi:hypothetical protein
MLLACPLLAGELPSSMPVGAGVAFVVVNAEVIVVLVVCGFSKGFTSIALNSFAHVGEYCINQGSPES